MAEHTLKLVGACKDRRNIRRERNMHINRHVIGLKSRSYYLNITFDCFNLPTYSIIEYDEEVMHSFFSTVYEKHQIKKFSYSYGISYVANFWNHTHSGMFLNNSYKMYGKIGMDQSLGLEVSGYYYLNSVIHAGIIYRPTIVTINTGIVYQQVVTLDVAFRFKTKE